MKDDSKPICLIEARDKILPAVVTVLKQFPHCVIATVQYLDYTYEDENF